ncbi:MAG TPA: cystathionine gamma-synthase family protein [Pseudomonadales bacterium]|nr:cystathionine gamma-synthase family protein [Pseudomonadales bacterium]
MSKKGFTTTVLHSDRSKTIEHGALHKPIHTSVAYEYRHSRDIAEVFQGKKSGYTYARQVNPTVTALEDKITAMEDGVATTCFSTGMAAITAFLFSLLQQGDHFVASAYLFGNTNSLFNTLDKFGIDVTFVDITDTAAVAAAIRPNTKALFVETIANPCTQIGDLAAIGDLCEAHGVVFVVDNTMTSPYLFRPKSVKASMVVNALTKCVGGHGDALGGSITETGLFDWTTFDNLIENYKKGDPSLWGMTQIKKKGLRDTGATLSPQAAHLLALGAETLALRQERSSANAMALATFFEAHPKVNKVYYPGLESHPQHALAAKNYRTFGFLMSIELHDSIDCFDFLDALELVVVSSNLGDNRTLAIPVAHTIFYEMGPARRAEMGITDGTVRLSIGIEDIDDLLADFTRALA